MKKFSFFSLMLLVHLCVYAQQTSLTIDNQTPGWLSSKINYGDQLTVQNLTVTGYLNKSDLEFIGTLIVNQSLNKKLDLTNSNIVGENNSKNDQLWENAFNINWTSDGNRHIEFLSLPLSLTGSINCLGGHFSVDTLVAGSFSMHKIEKTAFSCVNDGTSYNWNIKHIVLREGTDSIMDKAFGKSSALSAKAPQLQTISFPSTMKYIGKNAFYKCAQLYTLSLPDSIEEIYDQAFSGCGYSSDTLFLPKSLKKYHMRAIPKAKVIYFSKNIEYIDNYYSTYSNSTNTTTGHDVISNTNIKELHIESSIPPKFRYDYYKTLSKCYNICSKGKCKTI